MKKIFLTAVLLFAICMPAMAQTYSNGYISIPKDKVQLVSVRSWRGLAAYRGVEVKINFVGQGLCNSDCENYINLFKAFYKIPSDKTSIIVEDTLKFYTRGLTAGVLWSNIGGPDRMVFSKTFEYGEPEEEESLNILLNQIDAEFANDPDFKLIPGGNSLYSSISYIKK